jgi:hypothetical protein
LLNIEKSIKKEENKKEKIISLDKRLEESSGLLFFDEKIWTFNDS